FRQRRFGIEAFAVLVQRRHFQIGAEPHAAAVRLICTGEQVDQRGLARAVRPDHADAVAALDPDREILDDPALAIGLADALCLDNQPAGFLRFSGGEIGPAGGAAIILPLFAQRKEIAEPLDVALATCRDAVTQPVLLVDDLAIELVLVALFFGQYLVAPTFEGGKAA